MAHPTGETESDALRLDFDRRLMLQFRGSVVTSDAGLLAYRELDDALGLSAMAGEMLADTRTGKNGRYALVEFAASTVVSHGRYVVFQMAEVAIPRKMFQEICG